MLNFQRIIELFTQKNFTKLSKIWVWDPGIKIRDLEYGKNLFRISDSGVKKAPDPGSGSATLGATISGIPYWYDPLQNIGIVKSCTHVHNYEHEQASMVTDLRRRPVISFLYWALRPGESTYGQLGRD